MLVYLRPSNFNLIGDSTEFHGLFTGPVVVEVYLFCGFPIAFVLALVENDILKRSADQPLFRLQSTSEFPINRWTENSPEQAVYFAVFGFFEDFFLPDSSR